MTALATRLRGLQMWTVAWMAFVWVALWGELSVYNIATGVIVAVVVCLVFPLPDLRLRLRVRPVPLAWLLLRFAADIVTASAQVSWLTLQLRRQPRNAVVEVPLQTPSDFVLTVVAEMTSLVPGSLVLEARRSTHTLYLHVLDARDQAGVERMRRDTYALERRVVRAFGAQTDHLDPPASTDTGAVTPQERPS